LRENGLLSTIDALNFLGTSWHLCVLYFNLLTRKAIYTWEDSGVTSLCQVLSQNMDEDLCKEQKNLEKSVGIPPFSHF